MTAGLTGRRREHWLRRDPRNFFLFTPFLPSWWGTHDGERSVYYNAQENPIQTLMRIQHTMLGTTLTDPLYHLLILIHVCIMYFNDEIDEVPTLDTSILVGLPAALHIFLVIFYVSECYRRYYELWSHCSAVNTMVYTWMMQLSYILSKHELSDDVLLESRGLIPGRVFGIDPGFANMLPP